MSLREELDALKVRTASRIPPEVQAIMKGALEELRASGVVSRALKVGDKAPEFTLPNAYGQSVSSRALLEKGPLAISFYRGRW